MAAPEKKELNSRKEFLATLSASVIVIDSSAEYILLVKNRKSKLWGLPAGGLKQNSYGTLETADEVAKRELFEETSLRADQNEIWSETPQIIGVINLSSPQKNRIGIVYLAKLKYNASSPDLRSDLLPLNFEPVIKNEISDVRFFRTAEVHKLISKGKIYRPEFNVGILRWILENRSIREKLLELPWVRPLNERTIVLE